MSMMECGIKIKPLDLEQKPYPKDKSMKDNLQIWLEMAKVNANILIKIFMMEIGIMEFEKDREH